MPTERDLSKFPRPNVAIDIAVLTVLPRAGVDGPGALAVLVAAASDSGRGRALPGRFLRERRTIEESVADVLRIKAGLSHVRATPRLLRVFDDPHRDPRAWTLSLAHSLTLPYRRLSEAKGRLVSITSDGELEDGEPLLFDHNTIVSEAATAIRERYERLPDPDGLLEEPFTMAELRSVHEAVLGDRLLKDTFRRRMEPNLEPVLEKDGNPVLRSDGGRPAQVYERGSDLPLSSQRRLFLPRAGG